MQQLLSFKFLKVQWLHFTGVVDTVTTAYGKFSQDIYIAKIIKMRLFLTELLENYNVITFLKHG